MHKGNGYDKKSKFYIKFIFYSVTSFINFIGYIDYINRKLFQNYIYYRSFFYFLDVCRMDEISVELYEFFSTFIYSFFLF